MILDCAKRKKTLLRYRNRRGHNRIDKKWRKQEYFQFIEKKLDYDFVRQTFFVFKNYRC